MNESYRCIIVDDNEIDRLTTLAYVRKQSFLQVNGVYDNGEEALKEINKTQPEVLFLDIDMPGISGMDLRRQLQDVPACIFITSYPDYAVESFDLAALDFLVKPFRADRFGQAMNRLQDYLELRHKSSLFDHHSDATTIFIKDGHNHVKISLQDILYLEALKDYTRLVTKEKKYCVLSSLGNLLKEPSFAGFIRVHRSYAVQKDSIDRITAQDIYINDIPIPVGRSYKAGLQEFSASRKPDI